MTTTAYLWCGAPTTTSLRPVFVLDSAATSVRAAFSTDAAFTAPTYSASVAPDPGLACRPGDVTGLDPDTRYYYCAEIDGVLDTANTARAATLPTDGPVTLTFGSCWAGTGQPGATTPDHAVGSAVAARHDAGAHLHIFDGDMGYLDGSLADPTPWSDSFAGLHALDNFAAMARAGAWTAMWDDHDFGGDNSDATYTGKADAAAAWRRHVPLPDLPATDAIYHAFDLGPDVRIVVTDLRYFRSPDDATDDAAKTMLGATQKQWLKDEWLAAKAAGKFIIWVSTSMWGIDGQYATQGLNIDGDGWWAYTVERAELDDFRSANGITDMAILTGDGHQIAYRTGIDYSQAQDVPVPMFATAAYSRTQAYRPGAWEATSTAADSEGHYGVLTVARSRGGWRVGCDFHTVAATDAGDDTVAFAATVLYGNAVTPGYYAMQNADGTLSAVAGPGGVPLVAQYA